MKHYLKTKLLCNLKKCSLIYDKKDYKKTDEFLLYTEIKQLIDNARSKIVTAVNSTITMTYFEIGKHIVNNEQKGKLLTKYSWKILEHLAEKHTDEYSKEF